MRLTLRPPPRGLPRRDPVHHVLRVLSHAHEQAELSCGAVHADEIERPGTCETPRLCTGHPCWSSSSPSIQRYSGLNPLAQIIVPTPASRRSSSSGDH
jgi:hypothetical protein